MSPLWNVEAALEEVVDAIEKGSGHLGMDAPTKKMVKDLYRTEFEKHSEAEWNLNRQTILGLAKKAGSFAEAATIVLWANNLGTVGKVLDLETVGLVCVMVSRLDCPIVKGAFCQDVKYSSKAGVRLDQILKNLMASV